MTWTPGISAIGTVSASQGVDLTVETTGVVKAVMFKANDKVSAGQVLLQLDDAVQRADLEAARTQAALDKQALERAEALLKRGVGNAVTVDTASAAASTSASQVAKLQAVLDQKQLVAPFNGTIGIRRSIRASIWRPAPSWRPCRTSTQCAWISRFRNRNLRCLPSARRCASAPTMRTWISRAT